MSFRDAFIFILRALIVFIISYTTNLVTSEENDEEVSPPLSNETFPRNDDTDFFDRQWWGGVAHVQVRADGTMLGQQGEAPWLQDYPAGFRA